MHLTPTACFDERQSLLPRPRNVVKTQVFGGSRLIDSQVDLSPSGLTGQARAWRVCLGTQ